MQVCLWSDVAKPVRTVELHNLRLERKIRANVATTKSATSKSWNMITTSEGIRLGIDRNQSKITHTLVCGALPKGMWKFDYYNDEEDPARLITRRIDGLRIGIEEWEECPFE